MSGALSDYDYPHGWRLTLGLGAVPALIQMCLLVFLPESPRWEAKYASADRARQTLTKLRGAAAADIELRAIQASLAADSSVKQIGFCEMMGSPSMRRALALGCVLQLIQQLSGINTVMYYCGTILVAAGFTSTSLAIWLTALVSAVGFVFTIAGVWLVERLGRRQLTLGSLGLVSFFLVAIGGGFYYSQISSDIAVLPPAPNLPSSSGSWASGALDACNHYPSAYECVADVDCGFCTPEAAGTAKTKIGSLRAAGYCVTGNSTGPGTGLPAVLCGDAPWSFSVGPGGRAGGWITLVATAAYLAVFQAGMGPMPWTINAEIYPLRARSMGVSVATFVNWVGNLLISFTFLDLVDLVSAAGAFWIYASIAAVGWVWIYAKLPETRGLGLEEIEKLFQ